MSLLVAQNEPFGGLQFGFIEIINNNSTKAAVHFRVSDCEIFVMQPPLIHLMFHFYK